MLDLRYEYPLWVQAAPSRHKDMGWHAPNSVNARDIVPVLRSPGGGVTSADLKVSYGDCLKDCIDNMELLIADAERRKGALQKELKRWNEYNERMEQR